MDVLWGAWVKDVKENPSESNRLDIIGIYDTINKDKEADFPFTTNLKIVVMYQATSESEYNQIYQLTFDCRYDYGTNTLFKKYDQIIIPENDLPIRLYETYQFDNIVFKKPTLYKLNISIDRIFMFVMPLWVYMPQWDYLDKKWDYNEG